MIQKKTMSKFERASERAKYGSKERAREGDVNVVVMKREGQGAKANTKTPSSLK